MNSLLKKDFRAVLVLLLMSGWLSGQNLVPNYSFETLSYCPETYGGSGPSAAPPWFAPTTGTPDIFNECCTSGLVDVPANFIGNQTALTGVGYAGGYTKYLFVYREYLTAQLSEPLEAGQWYSVSFFASPAENGCAVQSIGAYFSVAAPPNVGTGPLPLTPQIQSNSGYINDFGNWTLISGCFLAEGGELFITIGNFLDDANTPLDPSCSSVGFSYYYYEDVVVQESEEPATIPLDLGGPEEACFEYEIDPMVDGYIMSWEGGSHGPTLTVTESGTYSLTISDGCNYGVDSIEIIINGNNTPPELGPPQLTLCAGETYEISLDPDIETYTWHDGSHDPEYTISDPGNYAVTLDDGCATYEDDITVFYIEPPAPVDLGPDLFLCSGDEITYSFDPTQGDYTWQDGMITPDYSVDMGGTYSVTVSNVCGSETDEVIISDLEVPEIEIGPDEQILCLGEIIEIEIDPDLGDILWNDGSTQPNYEITTAGTYTVFVTNQCGTGSDQIEVTTFDTPVVELGPDMILCPGETFLLTTFPVNGNYTWQDGSTDDTYLVDGPGTYSLTIDNFCGSVTDVVVVEYHDDIIPFDFGPDVSLCPGEQIVLHTNNPDAEYLWHDFSTADTFLVTTTGTYSVQVFNECGLVTDTIHVTVNDSPPQVDLPDQLTLCQGQSITLDALVGGVNYLWNDNSNNQQLVVNSPGTYSVTVSNTCGSDQDAVVILDGGPAPLVELGNDVQVCAGESFVLNPTFSNVDTWLWQDGSVADSLTIIGAGAYSVEVNNSCGVSFDTMHVSLIPATPSFELGADTALCAGEIFSLNITLPGYSILWSDGSSAPDFTINAPGEYYADVTGTCGTTSDTVHVTALPPVPALDLGADQFLCPGELYIVDPGIAGVTYLWQDGTTNPTYQTTQEGTIILSISNSCGSTSDTLEIIENSQGPQLDLGPDVRVCEGETVTINSGISGVSYAWQDGSTGAQYIATTSGVFILTVSNNCGSDADTVVVDVSGVPPTPDLGTDTTLCEGLLLTLVSTADAETSVLWQDGSSQPTFVVSVAGVYILNESHFCGDASDTIQVDYLEAPKPFSLGPDTVLCPGEIITLTAPVTNFTIEWQDGSQGATLVADNSQTYSLEISNECGVERDEMVLDFDTRVPVLDLGPDIPWCEGEIVSLDASQAFNADYLWSDGEVTPSITVFTPGSYSVEITTPCSVLTESVDIIPGDDCVYHDGIAVPNVFSPNGDQINDLFFVSFGSDLEVTSMKGSITDRWGNLVYSSDQIPFNWDGRFGGDTVNPGVYVYLIHVTYINGTLTREETLYGDVTVIR